MNLRRIALPWRFLSLALFLVGCNAEVNDIKVKAPERAQPTAEKPRPAVSGALSKSLAGVRPASANMPPAPDAPPAWQVRTKQTADQIAESIKSKKEAGELEGFEVLVEAHFGKSVYLLGKVASEQARDTLLSIAREHPEACSVHDFTQLVEEGTELPDKVTSRAAKMYPYRTVELDWDDD